MVSIKAFAQNTLYVFPGASVYISRNTNVYIDGMQVKQRVYHLLQTLPAYSGEITTYYQDSKLNGLAENSLFLNLNNGNNWNAFMNNVTRNDINNFVTIPALTGDALNHAILYGIAAELPVTTNGVIEITRFDDQWIESTFYFTATTIGLTKDRSS
jgi:hypothetical protein